MVRFAPSFAVLALVALFILSAEGRDFPRLSGNSATLGQANTLGIFQKGGANGALVGQNNVGIIAQATGTGGSNDATLDQSNDAFVLQAGRGGSGAVIDQSNFGLITQTGGDNDARITQRNSATGIQLGGSGSITATQSNDAAPVHMIVLCDPACNRARAVHPCVFAGR